MNPQQFYNRIVQRNALPLDTEQFTELVTDIEYYHLFGLDTAAVRVHFHLPPDASQETIRDCMGIDALRCISKIESVVAAVLESGRFTHRQEVVRLVWDFSDKASRQFKANNPSMTLESGE